MGLLRLVLVRMMPCQAMLFADFGLKEHVGFLDPKGLSYSWAIWYNPRKQCLLLTIPASICVPLSMSALRTYLSTHVPTCLSTYLPIDLSMHRCTDLSIISIYLYLSFHPTIDLSTNRPSIHAVLAHALCPEFCHMAPYPKP